MAIILPLLGSSIAASIQNGLKSGDITNPCCIGVSHSGEHSKWIQKGSLTPACRIRTSQSREHSKWPHEPCHFGIPKVERNDGG